jgi:L-amino acid N-acyltransferase YncA
LLRKSPQFVYPLYSGFGNSVKNKTDMKDILRPMQSYDTEAILKIYEHGIAGGQATIGTRVPACEKWNSAHIHECHMVSEIDDVMFDWDTLPKALQRKVCEGVAEVSSYISGILQKISIVSILLEGLITSVKEADIWTVQAQIFPENIPSISLLKKHGFRQNGTLEKIALMTICIMAGLWRDVVLIERRSKRVGD